jgi:hypothetical protein
MLRRVHKSTPARGTIVSANATRNAGRASWLAEFSKPALYVVAITIVMHYTPVAAQKGDPPAQLQANSYAHLIGIEYEGGLDIPGWKDQGGGLMAESVWYHFYKRQDDAYLVLMSWSLPRKPNSPHTPFRVTDVLLIPPIAKDHTLTFFCEPPRTNVFEKIFSVVRLDLRRKWWRDVRKAWKVDLGTGTISPVPTKGIGCLNEGFGA